MFCVLSTLFSFHAIKLNNIRFSYKIIRHGSRWILQHLQSCLHGKLFIRQDCNPVQHGTVVVFWRTIGNYCEIIRCVTRSIILCVGALCGTVCQHYAGRYAGLYVVLYAGCYAGQWTLYMWGVGGALCVVLRATINVRRNVELIVSAWTLK